MRIPDHHFLLLTVALLLLTNCKRKAQWWESHFPNQQAWIDESQAAGIIGWDAARASNTPSRQVWGALTNITQQFQESSVLQFNRTSNHWDGTWTGRGLLWDRYLLSIETPLVIARSNYATTLGSPSIKLSEISFIAPGHGLEAVRFTRNTITWDPPTFSNWISSGFSTNHTGFSLVTNSPVPRVEESLKPSTL